MVYDRKPWLKSYDADVDAEIEIKVYEFVDAIPLTSVGKVDKKALRIRQA